MLPDLAATLRLGEHLGRSLPAPTVILLHGDLGSGKTSLVQGIGRGLGISAPILSPTFTLVSEYYEGRIPLYHLDLYRLSSTDVDPLHLDLYWEGEEFPPGIVAIEWAERLTVLPPRYLDVRLAIAPSEGRMVHLNGVGLSPPSISP